MQKALEVSFDSLVELNGELEKGWKVIFSTPQVVSTGGPYGSIGGSFLVIISDEK